MEINLAHENELISLINGDKPMVSYCRVEGERRYHYDVKEFNKYCISGRLIKLSFSVDNELQDFKILYDIYAPPEQTWRLTAYKAIKKIGQYEWNKDLERIESILLGY